MVRLEGTKKPAKKETRREEVQKLIQDALGSGALAAGQSPLMSLGPLSTLDEGPRVNPLTGTTGQTTSSAPTGGHAPVDGVSATGNSDRDWIIQKESEGNPRAKNPNSSAFGLGQLIKANREAYGKRFGFSPETTNPQEQLQMMDAYVKERYGSYANARKFWEQNNWY